MDNSISPAADDLQQVDQLDNGGEEVVTRVDGTALTGDAEDDDGMDFVASRGQGESQGEPVR